MKCCECGEDSTVTGRGMCPACLAAREREVEERALCSLERIAEALERLARPCSCVSCQAGKTWHVPPLQSSRKVRGDR